MNGENVKLEDGEAVLFTVSEENYGKEELTLGDQTYRIKKETDTLAMAEKEAFPYMDQYYLFVKDESILNELIKKYGKGVLRLTYMDLTWKEARETRQRLQTQYRLA